MIYYKEFKPNNSLRDKIECYWILEITNKDIKPNNIERVIPMGFSELIFHFGDNYLIEINNSFSKLEKSLFTSQLTSSINFKASGKTGILGVKFKPFGAYFFIPKPLFKFENTSTDLKKIFNIIDIELLEKNLYSSVNEDKIRVIEQFLMKNQLKRKLNLPIEKITNYIIEKKGNIAIFELVKLFNSTISTFERNFKKIIGISPKKYTKIIQFNEILKEYKKNNDLQSIAYKYHYYDYSHFTKEFSGFSGFSPKSFKTTKKSITENLVIQENADFLHKNIE